MKIYIFGSCSGTEPIENRRHTSFAIEKNGCVYWFDAGEGCSRTAHLMGVDLLSVSKIFISHTHIDHIGGLANLLWCIRKVSIMKNEQPHYGNVEVFIPNVDMFKNILSVLEIAEDGFETEYENVVKQVADGSVFKNDDIEVIAKHNLHLPKDGDFWRSFSFQIRMDDKILVYSGDVKSIDDLSEFLEKGCDMLFIETGHHNAENICKIIKEREYGVKRLCFLHHGRGILNDYDGTLRRCKEIFPSVHFCNDKDFFEL